jgi:hypothetical protein
MASFNDSGRILRNDGKGYIHLHDVAANTNSLFLWNGWDASFCRLDAYSLPKVIFCDYTRKHIWIADLDGSNLMLLPVSAADSLYLARPTMDGLASGIGRVVYTLYGAVSCDARLVIATLSGSFTVPGTPSYIYLGLASDTLILAGLSEAVISRDGNWIVACAASAPDDPTFHGCDYLYGIGTDGYQGGQYWRQLSIYDTSRGVPQATFPSISPDLGSTEIVSLRFGPGPGPYIDSAGQATNPNALYEFQISSVTIPGNTTPVSWPPKNAYWLGNPCFWPDMLGIVAELSYATRAALASGTMAYTVPSIGPVSIEWSTSDYTKAQFGQGAYRVAYYLTGGGSGG